MKKCSHCKQIKNLDQFGIKKGSRDGKQYTCRVCMNLIKHEWYLANKEKHYQRVKLRDKRARAETHKYILDYLSNHPCVDCGESDVVVLEFDHQNNKERNISKMIQRGVSWSKILWEISKCQVRCANCHRRRTAQQQGSYRIMTHSLAVERYSDKVEVPSSSLGAST